MDIIVDIIGGITYSFAIGIKIAMGVFGFVSLIVGVCLVSVWTYGIYLELRSALRSSLPKAPEGSKADRRWRGRY